MIGKISTGKSFRGCLSYCLEDKALKHSEEVAFKNRAEVLFYNQCFGNKEELIRQFNEVRLLNQKASKPVMHITLSLAPGEQLRKDKLEELCEACASEMGFQNNQYIAIAHRDTDHQHLHLMANRIGFDGKTVSDSNSYKKMAAYCRKMELKYGLKQVLSPRRYISKEERQIPRLDQRKERLKGNIRQCLSSAQSYPNFEASMKQLGYQIQKGRGISFLDDKGVKVKGSDVGYSLKRVEQILASKSVFQQEHKTVEKDSLNSKKNIGSPLRKDFNQQAQTPEYEQKKNGIVKTIEMLLQPEKNQEGIDPNLVRKKRKKQKRSQHL